MDTCNVLGYNVFSGDVKKLIFSDSDSTIINTINAYSYVISKGDPLFKEALLSSDILLPDGFSIVIAARLLTGRIIEKIAGEDIFFQLLEFYNNVGGKVFFLGASNETLLKIECRLQSEYSKLVFRSFSPPFKKEFSIKENREMVEEINSFAPDVLFVGMTAPKQEKWAYLNKERINTTVICSIGAVFDFYAGRVKRPHRFWISLRLEWFIRLIREPKRLWRRYLVYSPRFFIDLIKEKISEHKS